VQSVWGTVCLWRMKPQSEITHPQVLVGSLLELLGHGGWLALGESADSSEDTEGDGDTNHGVSENLPALSWWSLGAWAVWTESNPVGCEIRC